ncbi:14896_t:CDS:1, partial [Racocetra persica]
MKQLEKEIIINMQETKSLVFASLSDITADLLQGNDLARVKRYSAIRGYYTCNTPKDLWTSE